MKGLLILVILLTSSTTWAQPSASTATPTDSTKDMRWWEPAYKPNKQRFWGLVAGATLSYGGLSAGLWKIWYSQYPLSKFHTFNDWPEWLQVDKAGHFYSAYNSARVSFHALRWSGQPNQKSALLSTAVGLGFLSTIEVMDGFSEKWGFSLTDMSANLLGAGLFIFQQLYWKEQRILLKVSSSHPPYPSTPIYSQNGRQLSSLQARAASLYGRSPFERLLKDYNAQTTWISFNIAACTNQKPTWLPKWLNIAIGYGADNMFGGFNNSWKEEGFLFTTDLQRYRQYYLSFDIDFSRLPANDKALLRGLYHLLNLFKFPSPTLELNSLGQLKAHWIYW